MRHQRARRALSVLVALALVVIPLQVLLTAQPITAVEVLLAATAFLFGYLVLRLSETMVAAKSHHRRGARRALILMSVVPALVLVPTTLESSTRESLPIILVATGIWLAAATAFTSFILARAGRDSTSNSTVVTRSVGDEVATGGTRGVPTAPVGETFQHGKTTAAHW